MWAVISDALASAPDGDDLPWRAWFFELAHATLSTLESLDEAPPRRARHNSVTATDNDSAIGDRDD